MNRISRRIAETRTGPVNPLNRLLVSVRKLAG